MANMLTVLIIFGAITVLNAARPETTAYELRRLLTEHFNTPRHHRTNPIALNVAQDFIYNTFMSYNMQTFKHTFPLEKNGVTYQGSNVVGVWPGRRTMTSLDRPVLLTAHYETPYEMPGYEDNGGGLAALLEAARLITSQPCLQDYTIFFAAFDFAANFERSFGKDSPCQEIGCGCRAFLEELLLPFVEKSGFPVANFQGAIVLDGVLNYNNTPGAQEIPAEDVFKSIPGFVSTYNQLKADGLRGNFLVAVSREHDASLVYAFSSKFDQADNPQYKRAAVTIPHMDVFGPQARDDKFWPVYYEIIDADIYGFYKVHPELKAMLLTDTVHLRGRETRWNDLTPADSLTLTDDRLNFLKKTTNVLTRTLEDMARHTDTCEDPKVGFPVGLQKGLKLNGMLHLNANTMYNVTFTVKAIKPRGVIEATLSSYSMDLDFYGIFDPVEGLLTLRFREPHKIAPGPLTMTCTMIGKLLPFGSGLVFNGEMRGVCGQDLRLDETGHPNTKFVLFNPQAASRLPLSASALACRGNAMPVVLALVAGMAFSAAVAFIAFIVYRRRVTGFPATYLVMNENKS